MSVSDFVQNEHLVLWSFLDGIKALAKLLNHNLLQDTSAFFRDWLQNEQIIITKTN
jgi:hypothetical protein